MAPRKTRPKSTKAGVIGLGNMGGGIARNLIKAGFETHVWDVAEIATQGFAKTATISEPAEMAARCSVIFFVVPGSTEIEALLKGRNGMLARARRGQVLCDFTTSDPVHTKKLARRAKAKNIAYLDAGMSGGATNADSGTLTLMMGGEARALKKVRPILDAIANQIFLLGPSGAGHTMKLMFNMVVHTNFMAVCEAGHLAASAGIPLASMIDVFNAGNARSFVSERRFPDHILSETWDGRSRVYNLHKDVGMAVAFADKVGLPANLGKDTYKYLKKAVKAGMSEDDFSLIFREFVNLNK